MLFNRALVSSLLFGSAVFAGRPNRKAGTLDRVEESIDGQYVNSTNWAGAALLKTPVSRHSCELCLALSHPVLLR